MKWINVKERLPDKLGKYLVWVATFNNDLSWGQWATNYFYPETGWLAYPSSNITHWLEIEPPEEENK